MHMPDSAKKFLENIEKKLGVPVTLARVLVSEDIVYNNTDDKFTVYIQVHYHATLNGFAICQECHFCKGGSILYKVEKNNAYTIRANYIHP